MRGSDIQQHGFFSYLSPEGRVPEAHPLRRIRTLVEKALRRMDPELSAAYARHGRPSIPPERLLKAQLLMALFSIRSDRQFCEQLDYNLLFRWFLGLSPDDPIFNPSTFSKNRDRFLNHGIARRLRAEVTQIAREEGLLSDEAFSVDGTLIEAWASMKSFKPIETADSTQTPIDDDDSSNPTVDFRGEKRSNNTHRSTTDPDARLYKKGKGKSSQLCHMGHVLMDNLHGLVSTAMVTQAGGKAEIEAMLLMLGEITEAGLNPKAVAGDAGYHTAESVESMRWENIKPHFARHPGRKTKGLDGRTVRSFSYREAQKIRKRIEEIFGWMKTIGGLRKSRFKGTERTGQLVELVSTAYNLLRIGKLLQGQK